MPINPHSSSSFLLLLPFLSLLPVISLSASVARVTKPTICPLRGRLLLSIVLFSLSRSLPLFVILSSTCLDPNSHNQRHLSSARARKPQETNERKVGRKEGTSLSSHFCIALPLRRRRRCRRVQVQECEHLPGRRPSFIRFLHLLPSP